MVQFNEAAYLAANPDVAAAVEAGFFPSGRDHFEAFGAQEGRSPDPNATGVRPLTVEPLNRFERDAITGLTDLTPTRAQAGADAALMQALGIGADVPLVGNFISQAGDLVQRATREPTANEFAREIEVFMNPFQEQVVDRATRRVNEDIARRAAEIRARRAGTGAQSFGDTALGTQLGLLEEEGVRTRGDITANTLFQGFLEAVGQRNTDRSRQIQGAEALNNLFAAGSGAGLEAARAAANISGGIEGLRRTQLLDALGAGGVVRQLNQRQIDELVNNLAAQQGFRGQQIDALGNRLGMFMNTGIGGSTQPSIGGRIGQAAQAIGLASGSDAFSNLFNSFGGAPSFSGAGSVGFRPGSGGAGGFL